jgi:hypothetical protein
VVGDTLEGRTVKAVEERSKEAADLLDRWGESGAAARLRGGE